MFVFFLSDIGSLSGREQERLQRGKREWYTGKFFLTHEKSSKSNTTKTQNVTGNQFNSICEMGITHRIAVKIKWEVNYTWYITETQFVLVESASIHVVLK